MAPIALVVLMLEATCAVQTLQLGPEVLTQSVYIVMTEPLRVPALSWQCFRCKHGNTGARGWVSGKTYTKCKSFASPCRSVLP